MEKVLNLCLLELNFVVHFHHTQLVKIFQCLVVCEHEVFDISHEHCLNNISGSKILSVARRPVQETLLLLVVCHAGKLKLGRKTILVSWCRGQSPASSPAAVGDRGGYCYYLFH